MFRGKKASLTATYSQVVYKLKRQSDKKYQNANNEEVRENGKTFFVSSCNFSLSLKLFPKVLLPVFFFHLHISNENSM